MRPRSVFYSKEAKKDIHAIFDYIQLFRPSAAERFVQAIDRAVQRLAILPRSGSLPHDRKLKAKKYRYAVIDEYLLFYRFSKIDLTILRLVHGRRHYVPLLLS